MLFFTPRRADQFTIARKFTGREAASAAREIWDREELRIFADHFC